MTDPADPFRFTTLAHAGRAILGPLSPGALGEALGGLSLPAPPAVLDVGCGKGELLLQALERLGGTGVGVDPNPAFLAEAAARARGRVPEGTVSWVLARLDEARLPEGAFSLLLCVGATHAFGGTAEALAGAHRWLGAGGRALLGVGYARRTPDPDYLSFLGAGPGELPPLPELVAQAREAGWRVEAVRESSLAEWDDYEEGYAAAVERWLAASPGDPEAPAFAARIAAWRDAYRRWGRETLGVAMRLLGR